MSLELILSTLGAMPKWGIEAGLSANLDQDAEKKASKGVTCFASGEENCHIAFVSDDSSGTLLKLLESYSRGASLRIE